MLIGEIAAKSGLSRDTIRFYEKQGLIQVGRKERRFNNYKEYPPTVLRKLATIKRLKHYGFTLNEIKESIELWETGAFDCVEEKPKLLQRVEEIEKQIQQLMLIKHNLLRSIENCPSDCDVVKSLRG